MNLTNEEKALIRDLNRNPVFTGLMRRAMEDATVPKYTPGKDGDQESDWKYRSGKARGIEFVVNLLGYTHER